MAHRASANSALPQLPPFLTLSPAVFRPLILRRVGLNAISRLTCTCKTLRDLIFRDNTFWRMLVGELFPGAIHKLEALKGLRDWRERFIVLHLLTRTFISLFDIHLEEKPPIHSIQLNRLSFRFAHNVDLEIICSSCTASSRNDDYYVDCIFRLSNGKFAYGTVDTRFPQETQQERIGGSLPHLIDDLARASTHVPNASLIRLRVYQMRHLLEFIFGLPLQATLNLNPSVPRHALIETALARRYRKHAAIRVVEAAGGKYRHTVETLVTKLSLPMWLEELLNEHLKLPAGAENVELAHEGGAPIEYDLRFLPSKASLVCTYSMKDSAAKTKEHHPKGKNERTRW